MYHAAVIVDLGVRPTRPLHYVHIKTLHLDGRDVVARPIIIIIFCLFSPFFLCHEHYGLTTPPWRMAALILFLASLFIQAGAVLAELNIISRSDLLDVAREPVLSDLRAHPLSNRDHSELPRSLSLDFAIRSLNGAEGCGKEKKKSCGRLAYAFFSALAASEAFRKAWRQRPVFIPAENVARTFEIGHEDGAGHSLGNWASGLFTLERDLLPGVDGTIIPGQRTGDGVRNGTASDRWEGNGPLQPSQGSEGGRSSTLNKGDVRNALKEGTVFFNHASLAFPSLAALSTVVTESFGLASNLNVYITPPDVYVSVPPHTDAQDALIIQTQGKKRWRVFSPPPPQPLTDKAPPDPFSRGKRGDVLTSADLGEPLKDVVLIPGDIMYIPAGFPHTTDTKGGNSNGENAFNETSLHLTVGLDSNIWGLTYAHVRSLLLKRSGLAHFIGGSATRFDEEAARHSANTLPIGFLGPRGNDGQTIGGVVNDNLCQNSKLKREGDGRRPDGGPLQPEVARYVGDFIGDLKSSMTSLEPNRWIEKKDEESSVPNEMKGREKLPSLYHFVQVVEFMLCVHLPAILKAQDAAFSNVLLRDPEYGRKVNYFAKVQKQITETFTAFGESIQTPEKYQDQRNEDTSSVNDTAEDRASDPVFLLLITSAAFIGLPAIYDLARGMMKRRPAPHVKEKEA